MHKRKHRKSHRDDDWEQSVPSTENLDDFDPCLYIQAHEADVTRGPPVVSARLLECQDPSIMMTTGNNSRSGLIRWGPPEQCSGDPDTVDTQQSTHPVLWVDR